MKSYAIVNSKNQPITIKSVGGSYPLGIFYTYKDAAKVVSEFEEELRIIEVEVFRV
ncbi:hypothetical protein APT65_00079 [Trabzonvirus APT65]|uniref:Uncharacterized protein n=1 Tax=Aeromonas phage APT65 TaxID=2982914 RepID=A0A9E8GH36_9CAUD|nr:hypothetical protein APT65_00079 [Aeromonas phage APT65]